MTSIYPKLMSLHSLWLPVPVTSVNTFCIWSSQLVLQLGQLHTQVTSGWPCQLEVDNPGSASVCVNVKWGSWLLAAPPCVLHNQAPIILSIRFGTGYTQDRHGESSRWCKSVVFILSPSRNRLGVANSPVLVLHSIANHTSR